MRLQYRNQSVWSRHVTVMELGWVGVDLSKALVQLISLHWTIHGAPGASSANIYYK